MKISKRLEDIKEISLVAYLYIIVYKKKNPTTVFKNILFFCEFTV